MKKRDWLKKIVSAADEVIQDAVRTSELGSRDWNIEQVELIGNDEEGGLIFQVQIWNEYSDEPVEVKEVSFVNLCSLVGVAIAASVQQKILNRGFGDENE